jgi:peptide/nickel transport system permease protein
VSAIDPTLRLDLELDGPTRSRGRRRPSAVIVVAMVVLAVVLLCAIAGSAIAPSDPLAQNLGLVASGPVSGHPLGTDELGRDVLSRVIAGARLAVVGPFLIAIGAMLIGTMLGLLAGYRGGSADTLIMRWVDLTWSLPAMLVVIVVAGVLGAGYLVVVALLTLLEAPAATRVIRGATLEQRPRPYVEAAETLGLSSRKVMFRHIWPNVLPVIVANTFLTFAFALVSLAGLAFVGIGTEPQTPNWGHMLFAAVSTFFQNPWTAIAPALMIMLTALSVNLIGDWIFEVLSDRGKQR